MAEIKDKVVTVESLSVLHEHNKNSYMAQVNPTCSGTMTMDGTANFSGNIAVPSLMIGTNAKLVATEDSIEIVFLNEEAAAEG